MTSLPDWLVERAALDEVPPASRARVDRADRAALAQRIAALHDDNARELAAHPAGPAIAQIERRVDQARRRRQRRRIALLGMATSTAAIALVGGFLLKRGAEPAGVVEPSHPGEPPEVTRVKGTPRLLAFRQVGERAEQLDEDTLVRRGDLVQLRYTAGGHGHGVIASLDGAGVVTLHFPARDDLAPSATKLASETTSLPHAYALDDAPRFERFFFITANAPIDVRETLAALRALGRRSDSATATLELPAGLRQWSLRLRKPDRPSTP